MPHSFLLGLNVGSIEKAMLPVLPLQNARSSKSFFCPSMTRTSLFGVPLDDMHFFLVPKVIVPSSFCLYECTVLKSPILLSLLRDLHSL